jgi:hypothetical protein
VAHERQLASHRSALAGEVVPEHRGLARAHREEAGEQAEDRGLPGAVRPGQEDGLVLGHVEIDSGERGEAPQEADGRAESYDERHGQALRRASPPE